MRKFIALVLILALCGLVGVTLATKATAEESNTRVRPVHLLNTLTTSGTFVAHGARLYSLSGYAGAANSYFGLYDCDELGDTATTNIRFEGGEASQYDGIAHNFGTNGAQFANGITLVTVGMYVTIEYE